MVQNAKVSASKVVVLVVQGDKDARVKKDQSDRMVEAIKKKGVPVHYLVLENEGHGFSRNESYLGAYQATDRLLDRYICGDTSVQVLPSKEHRPPRSIGTKCADFACSATKMSV